MKLLPPIHRRLSALLCGLCAALGLVHAPAAQAALGGSLGSVQADELQLHAVRRVASRSGFELHTLTLASGTQVREFVDASGTVFGVAWSGPLMPDLNQVLGRHFTRLVARSQQPHADHRLLQLQADDLVIVSGGRMRNFAGRAYLPLRVPAGVTPAQIQ